MPPDEPFATNDLSKFDVFRPFAGPALAAVTAAARWRDFEPGQTVLETGDSARGVLFVAAGQVRLFSRSMGGQEIILDELGPGQSFGEISVVDGGARGAGAVALTRTRICAIGAAPFMAFVLANPAASHHLMRLLAGLVREKDARLLELTVLPVRPRLIALLLRMARPCATGGLVVSPLRPHHELAARIGTGREVVSRTLGALQRDGLVRPDRGGLVLSQPQSLRAEVEAGFRATDAG